MLFTLILALLATALPAAAIAAAWLYERLGRRADVLANAVELRRAEAEAEAHARADRLGWESEALLWRARLAREDAAALSAAPPSAKVLKPAAWWPTAPPARPRPEGVSPLQAVVTELRRAAS